MTPKQFRKTVVSHYKKHGRHELPWRKTHDPYKILVSEVMLQQTQVERVIPYYRAWVKRWPTARALGRASLADVLRAWQGLGYNRRAKALHATAQTLSYMKVFPRTKQELVALPGIGDYTASAVQCFAFDQPEILIETNIRTAVTHHFFTKRKEVSDAEIREVLARVAPKKNHRDFYLALMDYGAHLKKSGVKLNSKAKGYVKQSTFKGSNREVRGAVLRALAEKPASAKTLAKLLGKERESQLATQLTALLREKMIVRRGTAYCLPERG